MSLRAVFKMPKLRNLGGFLTLGANYNSECIFSRRLKIALFKR
jgi:hypothetical protein